MFLQQETAHQSQCWNLGSQTPSLWEINSHCFYMTQLVIMLFFLCYRVLCVSVCVYRYRCICGCVSIQVLQVHVCAHVCTGACVYMYICVYMPVQEYVCVPMCVCMYRYIYLYMCVQGHICEGMRGGWRLTSTIILSCFFASFIEEGLSGSLPICFLSPAILL